MAETTPRMPVGTENASPVAQLLPLEDTQSPRFHQQSPSTPDQRRTRQAARLSVATDSEALLRPSSRPSTTQRQSRSPPRSDGSDDQDDMMRVAQIVGVAQDEEEADGSAEGNSNDLNQSLLPDEPSSALASRIMSAVTNPSPPPSPPLLSLFDPYHSTNLDDVEVEGLDKQFFLTNMGTGPTEDTENPLLDPPSSQPGSLTPPNADASATWGELISVDSIQPQDLPSTPRIALRPPTVDDLLGPSPSPFKARQILRPVVAVLPHVKEVDSMDTTPDPTPEPATAPSLPQTLLVVPDETVTPLRRSSRPRRSTTPNPPPPVPPSVPQPPSTSRLKIRRKSAVNDTMTVEEPSDLPAIIPPVFREPFPAATTTSRSRQSSPMRQVPFHRELGSLSPQSSDVLAKLGFSAPAAAPETTEEGPRAFAFSVFQKDEVAAPSTPTRLAVSGPIRIPSPVKETSPTKFKIQSQGSESLVDLPPRRVAPSPAASTPSTTAVAVPVMLTPARRILIQEADSSSSSPMKPVSRSVHKPSSPVKASNSSQLIKAATSRSSRTMMMGKGKGKEVEPLRPPDSASLLPNIKPKALPFPIAPSTPTAEFSKAAVSSIPAAAKASPPRSALKKPTSKIPRIPSKPYARTTTTSETKTTVTVRKAETSKTLPKPVVLVPLPRGAATSSTGTGGAASRITRPAIATGPAALKRKREAEKSSPTKPRALRPAVTSRRMEIPITKLIEAEENMTPAVKATSPDPALSVSRRNRSLSPDLASSPSIQQVINNPSTTTAHMIENSSRIEQRSNGRMSSPEPLLAPGSPMQQDPPPSQTLHDLEAASTVDTELVADPGLSLPPPSSSPVPEEANMGSYVRRTTRASRRAPAKPDGSGTVETTATTTATNRPSRRKPPTPRGVIVDDSVFSGMSITALKDLTASNTARNQHYLAAKLETEVVRKDGARPDSPLVKIKTVSQRQNEEKEKQRTERAARRARRSDEMGSSDFEGGSDGGYTSPCEELAERRERAHVRGSGEDEEYVTPEKPDRVIKRTRIVENGDVQEYETLRRTVKWDKGLFTEVCLDEVKLGTRQPLKENRGLKGILAPQAKALRLDDLGNLVCADTALTELVPENVVVKKFVYETDEPPVPPAPPVETIVVKSSRSRGKKKA